MDGACDNSRFVSVCVTWKDRNELLQSISKSNCSTVCGDFTEGNSSGRSPPASSRLQNNLCSCPALCRFGVLQKSEFWAMRETCCAQSFRPLIMLDEGHTSSRSSDFSTTMTADIHYCSVHRLVVESLWLGRASPSPLVSDLSEL